MKVCSVCKVLKDFSYFYNSKSSRDGKGYRCKECDSSARTMWKTLNPERSQRSQRGRNLKCKYGISLEDYEALLLKQGGKCVICKTDENKALYGINKSLNFAVDHCHKTGRIRGLLCNTCNRALGLFKDDKHLLRCALDYLQTH